MTVKKIANIRVVSPGSNPDVDSDFNTLIREDAIDHVAELYGEENVANIITFGTLAAKAAFKAMCTIYEIPFAQANRITGLIPDTIDGVAPTLKSLYDPESPFYDGAADFRAATSSSEWQQIVKGAIAIEGRNRSTGVHAAGVIISSKPLKEVIPLTVRQDDGKVLTQWEYGELEDLGLIKMDFLGLDTVDLIQHTVENIIKNGKTPPNMVDIIHGPMDDKKTFEMLQRGETIGVFQLASEGVQDLVKRMEADRFEDIVATTALYRPGPMGMDSHVKYADRKTGREEIEPIHPDFSGGPLDEILADTYGLVVYQEQVIRIASDVAGMTLQEGDDLRKAMGKKQRAKMEQMKPKFFDGTVANGYSLEAAQTLWDTIEVFAEYGFNKSHSVAYAQMAYKSAYLKANYPVEFMSALIEQHIHKRDKTIEHLNEAKRMGLTIGLPDINGSDVKISPDYQKKTGFDIIFGLSGVSAVSEKNAEIIVKEREENGPYTSISNLVERCLPLGITSRRIYQNLAKAGSFDSLGVSRQLVVENIGAFIDDSRKTQDLGVSLFDMFATESETAVVQDDQILMGDDYPYVDRLKHEADMIGQFLSEHPLDRIGQGASIFRESTIAKLRETRRNSEVTILASITGVDVKKNRRGGKTMMLDIDDGTGSVTGFASQLIVKGIDKWEHRNTVRRLYESGETEVPENAAKIAGNTAIQAIPPIETNSVYILHLTYRPAYDDSPENVRVHTIRPLHLADDGSLPIRIRLKNNSNRAKKLSEALPRSLGRKIPGEYPIYIGYYDEDVLFDATAEDHMYQAAIHTMQQDFKKGIDPKAARLSENKSEKRALDGSRIASEKKNNTTNGTVRSWPPSLDAVQKPTAKEREVVAFFDDRYDAIESLDYEHTGYYTEKSQRVKSAIEKYVGLENFDFGVFDPRILDE